MQTSRKGIRLIKDFEGCAELIADGDHAGSFRAYKKSARDPWTIGWGQTGKLMDGRSVEVGLIITGAEADANLAHFVKTVVDPLTRKHFPSVTDQDQFDALASWVYNINHSKLEAGIYSLPRYVAENVPRSILIDKWIEYRNPETIFEAGLYKRRLAELCCNYGADSWDAAWDADLLRNDDGELTYKTDPELILSKAGVGLNTVKAPSPKPVIEEAPLPPAEPAPVSITPKAKDPLSKPVKDVEYVPDDAEEVTAKDYKKSERVEGQGIIREAEKQGKAAGATLFGSMFAALVAAAERLTIPKLALIGAAVSIAWLVICFVRHRNGRKIQERGETRASELLF